MIMVTSKVDYKYYLVLLYVTLVVAWVFARQEPRFSVAYWGLGSVVFVLVGISLWRLDREARL